MPMARSTPSRPRRIRPQRHRNLHRHAIRRRKFLQHRQREQRLSLFAGSGENGDDSEENAC